MGPISERATHFKVGVPFTTDWYRPNPHWVFSPETQIVKRGEYYYPKWEFGDEK